jgi:hypothetical protein
MYRIPAPRANFTRNPHHQNEIGSFYSAQSQAIYLQQNVHFRAKNQHPRIETIGAFC